MSGRLPKGWRAYDFDEVASIASGQVDPRKDEYSEMLLVGSDNLPSGGGLLVGDIGTAKVAGAISGKYAFEPGQVIYSKIRPGLNKVWLSTFSGLCSADIYPISFDDAKLIPEYAYYCMLGDEFRKVAVSASMRSGIPKVNRQDLSSVVFRVSELDEQRRIVAVLDAADNLGSNSTSLLTALQARYKANLLKAYKPIQLKQSAGWRAVRFGEIFSERDERSADLPLLAITGEQGVVPRDELVRRDTSAADKSNYKVIRKGDIGYNTMRMWQGVCGLSQHDGIVSPAYTVVTPDASRILGRFAAHLFRHPRVIHTFRRYSQGLVDDTLMLKYPQFSEITLPIPDLAEQSHITETLDAQLGEVEQLRTLTDRRTQLKRGLLQKLLTGEWRLTHDLPDTEAVNVGA